MAESSGQSETTTLAVVAGVLGGLACLLLIFLVLRAYHWYSLKNQRQQQQQDVVERFSIEFLSQRLDASMNTSTGRRVSPASHHAHQPYRQQYPQSISEDFEGCGASDSEYVNSSMDYVNTAIELSQRGSAQPNPTHTLSSIGEMTRSDSVSSMDANPTYTPSLLDTSSNSGSGHASLRNTATSPTVEISASALQRPYAVLGGGAANSLAPQVHYQQPKASTLDATRGRQSPQVEAVRNNTGHFLQGARNSHGNRRQSPVGVRSVNHSSSNDVFVDGVHQNGRRQSPQLMVNEPRLKSMSTTSSLAASEMDEEYTPMMSQRKTSALSVDATYQNVRRSSPQLVPNEVRLKAMSVASSSGPSVTDEEYTAMTSPQRSMTSPRRKSTASTASGNNASPTFSPQYQNVTELADTSESCV